MAVPVWPSQVSHCQLRDGAGASKLDTPPVASETEAGTSLMRPRSGPTVAEISWRSVPWSGEEYQAFKRFLMTDLVRGTLVFDMPVHEPGEGYVNRKCQIKGAASGVSLDESQSPLFSVSFTLIVYNW